MKTNTLNVNYRFDVTNRNLNVKYPDVESPRDAYSFVSKLVNDKNFYEDFQANPIKLLKQYNFNTNQIIIPENFILPSQEELGKRLFWINKYEDFVSPSQMQSLPILPVIFVFIPIFVH